MNTIEPLSSGWERVSTESPSGSSHIWIRHIESNSFYQNEELSVTSLKCGLIFFATPLFCLGAIVFHGLRTALLSVIVLVKGSETTRWRLWELGSLFAQGVAWMARPLYFMVPLMGSALYGVIDPLRGRRWIGEWEKAWHQSSYRNDVGCKSEIPVGEGECRDVWTNRHSLYTYYLAPCMQARSPRR